MRRGVFAVALLATTVLVACPPKPGPGTRDAGAPDAGPVPPACANLPCPDGGMGCLTIAIVPSDGGSGLSFNPPPGSGGWSMCPWQTLVLQSKVHAPLCIDIRGVRGTRATIRRELPDDGVWPDRSLDEGHYCVAICEELPDAGCSQGCKDDECRTTPDTIRGNLDVTSKPDEESPRDAATP